MGKRKKARRWPSRFLRALGGTANVRLAARAAGVDHSSAYGLRKRRPAFARAWARALAIGRARLAANGSPAPQPSPASGRGSPDAGGRELVVRPSKRGTQVVRAGDGRWTMGAEERFFGELCDHANVSQAADAAGFSTTAVYNRRLRLPDFRARWAAALETGCARLEMHLIEAANRTFEAQAAETPEGPPRVTIAEALAILKLHRDSRDGGPGRPAGGAHGPREPGIEEVRDEVLRRLAAIRRHRERGR